jgi:GNAT superfamily N-acetyltransferase
MDAIVYYRRASLDDVESLVVLRLAFLGEISDAPDAAVRSALSHYFADALADGEFIAFLAVADSQVIASSGLVYHRHPPSMTNPTGREAYIMNMYTDPAWRRRGIATKLLHMLIDHARQNDCGKISLHVLPQGRSIYAKAGFVSIETEMRLNLGRQQ